MEFDGTEYNKEHFEKPSIAHKRLTEIIDEITQRAMSQQFSRVYFDFLATELLKKCEIKEKE